MNFKIALPVAGLAGLAGLLAAGATGVPADRLEFRPDNGDVLTKRFVTEIEFTLEDLDITMNGEEMPPEMLGGDVDLDDASGTAALTLEVSDEYAKVAGGRPLVLLRKYTTVDGKFELGSGESDDDSFEAIEGKTIRFEWDEEDGAYKRTLADEDDEVDEDDLAKLSEDLDLRVLLPDRGVSSGDTWRVSWDQLESLAVPGFDLRAALESDQANLDELPVDLFGEFGQVFEDATVLCTYRGTRDADGKKIGIIELSSTVEGSVDLTDAILAMAEEELPPEAEFELSLVIDLSLNLEGELAWDLAAGHAHAMDIQAELGVDINGEMLMEMMQMEVAAKAEASLVAKRTVTIE